MPRRVGFLIVGLIVLGLAGGWWLWRDRTRPEFPIIPLEGASEELVEAVVEAKARVDLDPRSSEAWGHLADLLGANGFSEQAEVCYSHAARFDSTNPRWPYLQGDQAIVLGKTRDGIPLMRQAASLARTKDESQAISFMLAGILIEEGMLDDAAVAIADLSRVDADGRRTQYVKGLLELARGNRPAAIEHFTKLLQSPNIRRRAHRQLANLADAPARAAAYLADAEKFPPDEPWRDPFTSALGARRVPTSSPMETYLGLHQQGQADEALEYLKRVAADSTDPQIAFTLGSALAMKGDFATAAEAFRSAIRLDPNHAQALMMLGTALYTRGSEIEKEPKGAERAAELYREAVEFCGRAVKRLASLGQAHAVRGRALRKLKRDREAIECFREAIACTPEAVDYHLELGVALAECGQVSEGVGHLEDALKLAPPADARPREALAKWKAKSK